MLFVAVEVGAVHISLSWGITMEASSNDTPIISVIDVYRNAFIKNITGSIPESPFHIRIFSVRHNPTI